VVEERVVGGGDQHRVPVGHGDLDRDAAGGLVGVGDERPRERRADVAVDDPLQVGVEDGDPVEHDPEVAGGADVALVAGEPDRVDLAGPSVLGEHAAGTVGAQAGVPTDEPVVVAAVAAEAGELLGLGAASQIRQEVEAPVGVPPDRPVPGPGLRGGRGDRREPEQDKGSTNQDGESRHRGHLSINRWCFVKGGWCVYRWIQVVAGKAAGRPRTGLYLAFPPTRPAAAWAAEKRAEPSLTEHWAGTVDTRAVGNRLPVASTSVRFVRS
jgi:hypothetical protein